MKVEDVNRLLRQFEQTQKMMRSHPKQKGQTPHELRHAGMPGGNTILTFIAFIQPEIDRW